MNIAKLSATGEKIRDLELNQQSNQIVASLMAFSIDIGMNRLTETMQQSLVVFIIKFFGHLSVDQLTLAFDMAVAGKLDAETKVYGSEINKQFVGHILGKFDKYRKANLKYAHGSKVPALPEGIEQKNKEARERYYEQLRKIKKNQSWDKVNAYHYRLIDRNHHTFSKDEKLASMKVVRHKTEQTIINEHMTGTISKYQFKAAMDKIEQTDQLKHAAMIHLATEWLKENAI